MEEGNPNSIVIQSFDIGVRHLGMAIVRMTSAPLTERGAKLEVLAWRCLDCCAAAGVGDIDVNKSTNESILDMCSLAWARLLPSMIPTDLPVPDFIFLES